MIRQWEYMVLTGDTFFAEAQLDEYGEQGWELVQHVLLTPDDWASHKELDPSVRYIVYFKRPKVS